MQFHGRPPPKCSDSRVLNRPWGNRASGEEPPNKSAIAEVEAARKRRQGDIQWHFMVSGHAAYPLAFRSLLCSSFRCFYDPNVRIKALPMSTFFHVLSNPLFACFNYMPLLYVCRLHMIIWCPLHTVLAGQWMAEWLTQLNDYFLAILLDYIVKSWDTLSLFGPIFPCQLNISLIYIYLYLYILIYIHIL